MTSGETVTFQCNDCNTEFALTLEPKDKKHELEDKIVTACPFCGSQSNEVKNVDTDLPDGADEDDEDAEDK